YELVFGLVLVDRIAFDQPVVRIGALRILVKRLHIRVRRGAVQVEVILLYILAMDALIAGESEWSLLENRILPVPERKCKAEVLPFVANPQQPVFAPAVHTRAGMVVGKVIPGRTVVAVVFAHGAPGPLAQVRAPELPIGDSLAGLSKPLLFLCHGF